MSELTNGFERHFLGLIARRSGSLPDDIRSLISRLIRATIHQHSCLDLSQEPESTLNQLERHSAFGDADGDSPLVIAHDRLYLRRFYRYESDVADMIIKRKGELAIPDPQRLKSRLDEHFGTDEGNRQKLAALLAISRKLAIVTGGPGTGKTSTVVKMLDILLEESPTLKIRLAAPTGKAAMRLNDSIRTWAEGRNRKPEVQTLHRLLGMRRDGRVWRLAPGREIRADLLIVDEASMVDLPMIHCLLSALREDTRLILLGDPNQLPSVETGNVLADLCAGDPGFSEDFAEFAAPYVGEVPRSKQKHALTDSICMLEKSYRFHQDSAIGRLALAIRQSEPAVDAGDDSVRWFTEPDSERLLSEWSSFLEALRSGEFRADQLMESFEQARILCSRRGGDRGVLQLNQDIETLLEAEGLKQTNEPFYPGRPVMVTRNDYNLDVFNGDIGICLPIGEGDYLVHFPGKAAGILASRLPEHETCFAMTVHKAQGSEFEHVMLVLGTESSEEASGLMTRELIYTAVTRARSSISIYSREDTWQTALSRRSRRVSGMTTFLGISQIRSEPETG